MQKNRQTNLFEIAERLHERGSSATAKVEDQRDARPTKTGEFDALFAGQIVDFELGRNALSHAHHCFTIQQLPDVLKHL